MVNRNLIRGLDLKQDWDAELEEAMGGIATEEIDWGESAQLTVNKIIEGRILRIDDEFVLVDVGYKSEGIIPRNEWDEDEEPPQPGDDVNVLIEDVEDAMGRTEESRGMIRSRKRKAAKDRLARGDGQGPRRRHRHRQRAAKDQGRPARRHRRQRVPAGQPGRYPPAQRHRRLHRPHASSASCSRSTSSGATSSSAAAR